MALSVGEIEATLRLRDEMSAQLRTARTAVDQFGASLGKGISDAAYRAAASTKQLSTEQTAYNSTVSKFMGYDLAEKATRYADAVEHVGGVTFLTRKEQQEVNKVMGEAIEKSNAMGDAVPLNIQRIYEATAASTQKFKDWGQVFQQAGQTLSRTGTLLTAAVTVPLAGAATASIKLGSEFESSMVKIENLTDMGKDGINDMSKAVLDLGVATGRGPDELAHALLVVGSTGLDAKHSMEVLTESAKAAAVGLGDTADIGRAVTAAMRAYGSENLNAKTAVEQLFVAVREGGAEADQFANTLGRVFGVAADLGVGFDEVTASVATFTRLGVSASEAVTALRGTMMIMLHPSKQARDAAAELGTSFAELRAEIREKGLAQTLLDLIEKTKGNEEALGKLFPNVRALAGVLGNAALQGKDYKEILGKIRDDHDSFDKAVSKTTDTTMFKWNQMLAEGKKVAIEFYETLRPTVVAVLERGKELLGWVSEMVEWWSKMPEPVKEAGIALGLAAAALGPLMVVAGQVLQVLGSLALLMGTGGAATIGGAATAGAAAISTLFVPALLAIAIPATLYELLRLFSQLKGYFDDMDGWDKSAKGLADTMKNEMATAARLAGHEFQTYAEAHAFMQQRINELRVGVAKSTDDLKINATAWAGVAAKLGVATTEVAKNTGATAGNTGAHHDNSGAVALSAEAVREASEVSYLMERAKAHETAAVDLSTTQWKANQKSVEEYIKHLPEAKLTMDNTTIGVRDMSGAVEQVDFAVTHLVPHMEEATSATGEWGSAISESLSTLPGLIERAFTGGGGFKGAMKAFGAQQSKDFFGELFSPDSPGMLGAIGKFIPGFGAAFGAILPSVIGPIFNHFFGTAGRDSVKAFAESFEGGFDGLHTQLLRLGDAGEQLWVKLTQGVGRNNPEQAKAVIADIKKALENIPPTLAELASQAGYQTTAQLEKSAADAVKLWEYMRDSGQYSATAVQDAWTKAQEALKKAGGEQLATLQASYDAAVANLRALDTEINQLQASVDSEAPEEAMGVVEAQSRARLEVLKKEREEAAKNVEEVQDRLQQAMDALAQSFKDTINDLGNMLNTISQNGLHIPLTFTGLPPGTDTGGEVPEYASGGFVDSPHLAVVGDAPEYITPVDHIGALARAISAAGGSGGGGGDLVIHNYTVLDGEIVDKRVERVGRKKLNRGSWTIGTRSVQGRNS